MNNKPKISVITVSYNSQNTIRETFDSVKSQKIKDFELEYIHVDGLSNDETMKISYDYDDIISINIPYEGTNREVLIVTSTEDKYRNHTESLKDVKVFLEPGDCTPKVLYK